MVTPTQAKRFQVATPEQLARVNALIPGKDYTVVWWYPGQDQSASLRFIRLIPRKKTVSVVFAHPNGRENEIPAQFIKSIVG